MGCDIVRVIRGLGFTSWPTKFDKVILCINELLHHCDFEEHVATLCSLLNVSTQFFFSFKLEFFCIREGERKRKKKVKVSMTRH